MFRWAGGCWASSRQSSSAPEMKSHDDSHCPVTFIIEKWKWMKNISLCFVSEWQVLTATFKLSHQHFKLYLVAPFLEAQTNESPSGHIWSHENIHHLPPLTGQTSDMAHDVRGTGDRVYVRLRLMDGPHHQTGDTYYKLPRERRVTRASWSGNSFIQINGMLLRRHYPEDSRKKYK